MKKQELAAIILAAGYATRFQGAFKPLATIGGIPVMEHAVQLFRTAGISDIVVVVGHRWESMGHKLRHLPVRFALNENCGQGMFSSIQTGVENLPGTAEGFFLLPVDIPLVRPQTVTGLANAYYKRNDEILYPFFMGRRGHPPLIARRLARAIGAWGGDGGLRPLLERYESLASDVPVADEYIHLDLDTRGDLLRLRKRYQRYDIPTEQECLVLLRQWDVPHHVILHCHAVTRVADSLAAALNNCGCFMNTDLLHAAALLHDCAKDSHDHAHTGAALIASAGFNKTADVVARHMDIGFDKCDVLDETSILYLADKLVLDTKLVTLDERLQLVLPRHRGTARQYAIRKLAIAQDIGKHVEMTIGVPLATVLAECSLTKSNEQNA